MPNNKCWVFELLTIYASGLQLINAAITAMGEGFSRKQKHHALKRLCQKAPTAKKAPI